MNPLKCISIVILTLCASITIAQVDTVAYSLGVNVGQRLVKQGAQNIDYQSLIQGMKAAMEGQDLLLDQSDIDKISFDYYQSQKKKKSEMNKEKGLAFLTENGARAKVTTTESGLQYEVLTAMEGPKPTAQNTVTVHYEGKLLNGTKFDSSVDRGEPMTFGLNRVIVGWTEGVQLMSPGSKYRFYIPQELAYGSRGAGGAVPPYSTLVFDIELLSFK